MDKVDEFFWQATLRPPEAWWGGLPGGEPFRAFTERVQAGMVQLLADFWAVSYDGDGHRLGELLSNVVDGG
jgi:broad specificity phosphatase PhoE